jgi:GNAT superfamily N-acetyltransferase
MVNVRHCTIKEIEQQPNFSELVEEYAAESSILGLPHPSAQLPMYHVMEDAGALYTFGAFLDQVMIGFVAVLSHVMPHYGATASTTESFFVAKAYRKTGAGTKLRQAAEVYAENRGSSGLLISAPHGGQLAQVLPHVGYRQTNDVFFKSFKKDQLVKTEQKRLPAMNAEEIGKVRQLESVLAELPQIDLETQHTIHGGTYSRTIMIPAGAALTGALLKIPTTLVVTGRTTVFIGDKTLELDGHNVLPASAGRKQAFYAHTDTWLTMFCATGAQTLEDIEAEMTDEVDLLSSHKDTSTNLITITGE